MASIVKKKNNKLSKKFIKQVVDSYNDKFFKPIPYEKISKKNIKQVRTYIINYVDAYLKYILTEFLDAEKELKRKLKK